MITFSAICYLKFNLLSIITPKSFSSLTFSIGSTPDSDWHIIVSLYGRSYMQIFTLFNIKQHFPYDCPFFIFPTSICKSLVCFDYLIKFFASLLIKNFISLGKSLMSIKKKDRTENATRACVPPV